MVEHDLPKVGVAGSSPVSCFSSSGEYPLDDFFKENFMFINAEKVKQQVIEAGLRMKEEGLIYRTYGNISARLSDDEFVITPSGRSYESLTLDDLVTVRIDDLSYQGDITPSSEKGVHAAIYKNRPDAGFVIHTHQKYATLLSTLGEDLPAPTTTIGDEDAQGLWKFFGSSVPCAEYGLNGSQKLIDAIEARVLDTPDSKAILMRNHGVLCFGKDYEETADVVKSLEVMSEDIYKTKVHAFETDELAALFSEDIPERDLYKYCIAYPLAGKHAILSSLPATVLLSQKGVNQPPYLDDVAMTVGVSIDSVPEDAEGKEILSHLDGKNGAVFLTGHGAICTGVDAEEAKIVALMVEKNCYAALLEGAARVTTTNARKEHKLYMDKYSKLMKKK